MTSLSRTAREFYHQPHGIGPGSVMRACDARPSDYVRCATLNWNASKESRGFFSGATPRLLDVLRRYHGADGESLKINTQKLRPGLSEALTIRAASAALTQTFTNAARPITNIATPKNPVASVSIKLNSHQVGICISRSVNRCVEFVSCRCANQIQFRSSRQSECGAPACTAVHPRAPIFTSSPRARGGLERLRKIGRKRQALSLASQNIGLPVARSTPKASSRSAISSIEIQHAALKLTRAVSQGRNCDLVKFQMARASSRGGVEGHAPATIANLPVTPIDGPAFKGRAPRADDAREIAPREAAGIKPGPRDSIRMRGAA